MLFNYSQSTELEWLETNGLGGWSSSTLIGCNTRRYHSLLMAATVPPAERMALVSKLEETIRVGAESYELGTNSYGNAVHPNGYQYLSAFSKELFPEFIYEAGGIRLKKTIAMVQGENTVLIEYEVLQAPLPFSLELLPLLSVRNYHSLMHANESVNREARFENDVFSCKAYEGTPEIFIKVPGAAYSHEPGWYYNFNYSVEQYRGLDFTEDLFKPGKFITELREGDFLSIIISTDHPGGNDAHELLMTESLRRQALLKGKPSDKIVKQLVLAADQFIVQRGVDLKTVIAGYHWFTDWGRDTMISLPGLCLSAGRYEDARKILRAFAGSVSMGMLPNRFQDNGEAPEYNNVDGTLWYFIAVQKYLQASNDTAFVFDEVLPVLKEIIDWHFKGTRYQIQVAEDGLLYAGEKGQQLTWMDARIGSWVVTPRMGKPVEIQALWYNALRIFAGLLEQNNQPEDAVRVHQAAEIARKSFIEKFWFAEGEYLYDNIDENGQPNKEIRPNQLFAISLPHPLIAGERARAVLKIVEEQLYTPVGLKSLSKTDTHYIPVYGGDAWHRDSCYHEGTVWSWLLGPYVDAVMRGTAPGDTGGEQPALQGGRNKALQVIENFRYHLEEGCIGSVSEIFDADPPHHPRGCIAQAWGVAEVLRVIIDYGLYDDK